MNKRGVWAGLLAALLLCGLIGGCSAPDEPLPEATPIAVATPVVPVRVNPAQSLIGFITPDDGSIALMTSMHGFLRTAETLGYPAKVYRAAPGAESENAVELANADDCVGLLIWNPGGQNDAAAKRAKELGIPVVVPYYSASGEGVRACTATDLVGYSEEVARGVAERMVERACKAGKILVYGRAPQQVTAEFRTAIETYYPQYNVGEFVRTATTQEAAIAELSTYLLWNRDIKGLFCTDTDGAWIAVKARESAQREFRKNGAPEAAIASPSPGAATPAPTPTPTPNPAEGGALPTPTLAAPHATPVPAGLIKSITISIAGMGISDETIALMQENDIYAFVLEPYYEASAQSLMLLDRILNGESVPAETKLNMPIVRQDSLDKYQLIFEQVREWFDVAPASAKSEA